MADKKSRQTIKKLAEKGGKVIVTGCYAQLKPDEIIKIKGVDLVLGNKDKFRLVEIAKSLFEGRNGNNIYYCNIDKEDFFHHSFSLSDRTRAFLKVQDGCDYKCAYCTVPLARGKSRNSTIESIVADAEVIANNGIKEIVLTGVNIGDFGKSTNESFIDLIKSLDKINGVERIRISSIEPNLLTDDIIKFVSESSHFVPHFHIPLQSGSDVILGLMGRRYRCELFFSRIKMIRKYMPHASVGVDVIVGFPGETEELFLETYNFIKQLDISYLHVFPFSERPNTRAFDMPNKVGHKEKEKRSKMLIDLSEEKKRLFYLSNVGRVEKVIFEGLMKMNKMYGFTSNYIKVETDYDKSQVGKIVEVSLLNINKDGNFVV